MASNLYVNRVDYGSTTLIDISDTTATASDVASGKTFYLASGQQATGTSSGGGSVTLKTGVIRPDAEVVKQWADSYWVVSGKGLNIPAYSTSAQTIVSSTNLTPTYTLDNTAYRYFVEMRAFVYPRYNTTSVAKGRVEYSSLHTLHEIVNMPPNTLKSFQGSKYVTTRNCFVQSLTSFEQLVYWGSTTTVALYTSGTLRGLYPNSMTPTISSGTADSPTLTVKNPQLGMQGSATYLTETYVNAMTDIRYQYIITVYRIPLNTSSTYGIDGFNHFSELEYFRKNVINTTSHNLY